MVKKGFDVSCFHFHFVYFLVLFAVGFLQRIGKTDYRPAVIANPTTLHTSSHWQGQRRYSPCFGGKTTNAERGDAGWKAITELMLSVATV
jgi:hypothetical protein